MIARVTLLILFVHQPCCAAVDCSCACFDNFGLLCVLLVLFPVSESDEDVAKHITSIVRQQQSLKDLKTSLEQKVGEQTWARCPPNI